MTYELSGNPDALVMQGMTIRCHTHKCIRVLVLKKCTEGQLVKRITKDGTVYI